jgi:hypothetical protein
MAVSMGSNAYQLFGITADATLDEIKAIYKKLAFQYHPDRGGSHEKMCQLNEAYERLCKWHVNPNLNSNQQTREQQTNKSSKTSQQTWWYTEEKYEESFRTPNPEPDTKQQSTTNPWRKIIDDLIDERSIKGYKKGWIYYQLRDKDLPLEAWQYCGQRLGYKPAWAEIKFQEQEYRKWKNDEKA